MWVGGYLSPYVLDKIPRLGALQVLNLVVVRGGEVGHKRTLSVSGDEDGARPSGLLRIFEVHCIDPIGQRTVRQLLAKVIRPNAADVRAGTRRLLQHPL